MEPQSFDLFLSYRSSDVRLAEGLHARLAAEGFRVWFDRARLDPGCNWHDAIEAGCEASRVVLPVLTPDWKESEWCRFETSGAEHVIPLLFAGAFEAVAPRPLRELQYLDFRAPTETDWQNLLRRVRDYLATPRPEKTARFAFLPHAHNPFFLGREKLLLEIHERLFQAPSTALTQGAALAVSGMGGVGKTTLAREYAEKFWRLYRNILWVRAEPDLLTAEFARLAVELGILAEPSADATQDARRALRELCGRSRRLLILDNASDEQSVQDWLPTSGSCHVLITSRYTGWSAAVATLAVDVLTPEAARELLLQRSGLSDDANRTAADRLARELGYLPLALEQAAAFARKVRIGLDRFQELLARSRAELLAQRTPGGTHYSESVATTWHVTVKRLGPLARTVLRLASFQAPDNIPVELVQQSRELLAEGLDAPAAEVSELDLRLALGELADYSMIALGDEVFSVHRLVQAVQRGDLDEAGRKAWAWRAVQAVNAVFPSGLFASWPRCEALLPHAQAAAQHVEDWRLDRKEAADLLNRLAIYWKERAQFDAAEPFARRALEIRRGLFGEAHPFFGQSLNNLGALYSATGRFRDAEPLFVQAVEIYRTTLGEKHRYYATGLNNLAALYQNLGDYRKAELLYRKATQVFHADAGRESPHFASSLNNLAVLFRTVGRFAKAEPLFRKAMAMRREAFGPGHPEYARSLINLADLYRVMGRFAEAEPLAVEATEILRTALGGGHPHYATSLNNLGALYAAMCRHEQAEQLYRRALDILRAAQGEGHPNVAQVVSNQALLCRARGELKRAEEHAAQAMEIRRAALGEGHLHFAQSLLHLAEVRRARGRASEAEPLVRQALAVRRDVLGENHPDYGAGLTDLAELLVTLGRFDEAEQVHRQGMSVMQSGLGAAHPDVVKAQQTFDELLRRRASG